MSDRICIHSNGTKNVRLSAEDLVSCCYFCGFNCMGGFPPMAWRHWVSSGIVSGGAYGSNQVKHKGRLFETTQIEGNDEKCQIGQHKLVQTTSTII